MQRKFLGGVFGQGAGLASTIVIQLAQVPVMIWALGTYAYGQYLLVIAVPSLLVISDFGILAAFSTAMLQAVVSGNPSRARQLSQLASALLVTIGAIALAGLLIGAIVLSTMPDFPSWSIPVFVIYGCYALVNIQTNAVEGILRAAGDQARTWSLVAGLRLIEFIIGATAVALTHSPVGFVAGLLIARIAGTFWLGKRASRVAAWSSRVPTFRSWREHRHLLRPMIGSLAQPATNYAYLQGTVLAVGALLGPTAVAELAVLRTLTGLLKQTSQVFTIASLPLLTHAATTGDESGVKSRYRTAIITVIMVAVLGGLALTVAGPLFISWWTHGSIEVSRWLVLVFTIEAICEAGLAVASMGLIASNRHFGWSILSFAISLAYVSTIWLVRPESLASIISLQILAILLSAGIAILLQRRKEL